MDRLAQKTEKEPVNKNQIGTEYRVRKENIDKCLEVMANYALHAYSVFFLFTQYMY
jgi:hypothetical protein